MQQLEPLERDVEVMWVPGLTTDVVWVPEPPDGPLLMCRLGQTFDSAVAAAVVAAPGFHRDDVARLLRENAPEGMRLETWDSVEAQDGTRPRLVPTGQLRRYRLLRMGLVLAGVAVLVLGVLLASVGLDDRGAEAASGDPQRVTAAQIAGALDLHCPSPSVCVDVDGVAFSNSAAGGWMWQDGDDRMGLAQFPSTAAAKHWEKETFGTRRKAAGRSYAAVGTWMVWGTDADRVKQWAVRLARSPLSSAPVPEPTN